MVKANAYGHGARRVALALEAAGATMLAVADIEEGVDLRQAGVRVPILVFGALSVSDVDGVFTHTLTPTISSPAAGQALDEILAAVQDMVRQVGDIASSSQQMAGGARSVTDAMQSISAEVE